MSSKMKNLIVIVIVVAGFTILYWTGQIGSVSLDRTDGGLVISGPDGTTASIDFQDVVAIEYVAQPDYGSAIDGGERTGILFGGWQSDAFGPYSAFVSTRIEGCILFRTGSGTVAFNYESGDTTRQFYESVLQYWEGQRGA